MRRFRASTGFRAAALAIALAATLASGRADAAAVLPEHLAARDAIDILFAADMATCAARGGTGRSLCQVGADGRRKVARAELDTSYAPTPENRWSLRIVRADAVHALARERCEGLRATAAAACRKDAWNALIAARVDAAAAEPGSDPAITRKAGTEPPGGEVTSQGVAYATDMEQCDGLAGEKKSACVAHAWAP